jgi:hypothetical protein
VLVPVHDQAAFLPRALGSLLAQDVPDWEVVVLDDGSPPPAGAATADAFGALLGGDPRARLLRWPANRGLGATLNAGLAATSAPVVAYLPADDAWFPDHLSALLAVLEPAGDAARPVLAWSGVRHHGEERAVDAPAGTCLQLVQVAHRRTRDRWTERAELESDDLELLLWRRLRGRGGACGTGRVTCDWTDHPGQRHKAIRESFDGGLNVFRSRYRVAEPLRFASSDSGTVDEAALYAPFRSRALPASRDGLHVLLVGELAFNPERVLALAERGHRLSGLWTRDGLGDATVGPLPFGHVTELVPGGWRSPSDWQDVLARVRPDVVHAQLNWRAVPFAHQVLRAAGGVPFVWHFKEAPQRSLVRGEWALLADLVCEADACLLATVEERDWMAQALEGRVDPARLGVLDGDLPKADWFHPHLLGGEPAAKLSASDGEPHTVVLGRPSGLTAEVVVGLARRGVHTHLHGQVDAPGPKGSWRSWLPEARAAAPGYVHLHPAVSQPDWLRVLSRYDAGWLHRFTAVNGGELRRASWDDLNTPARLPVLLGAGLPLLLQDNPGQVVAVQRIAQETSAGLPYTGVDDCADRLHAEVATGVAGAAALKARDAFTFDAHADRLVALFRQLAGR